MDALNHLNLVWLYIASVVFFATGCGIGALLARVRGRQR